MASREHLRIFAPGYGEFSTASGPDLEALALAVPTDALPGPLPAELETLEDGAAEIFDAAQTGDWDAASASVADMTAAWEAFGAGDVPEMFDAQTSGALEALTDEVQAQSTEGARQASIDVARASLDFQLRHRPVAEIDLVFLDLWARQILVDVAADDEAAIFGDVATLRWIRERIAEDAVAGVDLHDVDAQLDELQTSAEARDLAAVATAAARLRDMLAGSARARWGS